MKQRSKKKRRSEYLGKLSKRVQAAARHFVQSGFFILFFLELLNDRRKADQTLRDRIICVSKEFIEQKHLGSMNFKFDLVRPGAFYRYGRPCDCNSDGTLVVMADNKSNEVSKFDILGDDLACHLRNNFPAIFYPSIDNRLKREHPTLWSTLGYFDESDFDIGERFALILEELKSFDATVNVSQLEVRSYKLRSLEISTLETTIDL